MAGWAEGDPLDVAPRLLGAVLTHAGVSVRLTEVEAYRGPDDPGSHAHRGRTPRNATMFGPPGRLYVYFVYGMHHCANLVTGPDGDPGAVLLRAGEVVDGLGLARARRPGVRDRDLARGPARLCTALAIGRDADGTVAELRPPEVTAGEKGGQVGVGHDGSADVETGPRVGLRLAADRPWRFWLTGEETVSTYRPAAPRRRAGR